MRFVKLVYPKTVGDAVRLVNPMTLGDISGIRGGKDSTQRSLRFKLGKGFFKRGN